MTHHPNPYRQNARPTKAPRRWGAWLLAVVAMAAAAACSTPRILTPTPGPGECRPNEVACVEGDPPKATGFCCGETEACGGGFPNVGCPPGYCCPIESGSVEAKRPRRQSPAVR